MKKLAAFLNDYVLELSEDDFEEDFEEDFEDDHEGDEEGFVMRIVAEDE